MEQQDIDFVKKLAHAADDAFQGPHTHRPKAAFTWGRIIGFLISAFIFVGLAYTTKAVISGNSLSQQFGNASVFEQIKHLVGAGDRTLLGEEENRINILLLGIGGEQHEGGQLTDTIMLVSVEPSSNKVGLFSIPRDLVVPIDGVGWQKINAANAFGARMHPDEHGAGPRLAVQTISDIINVPIHYYVKIDFEGFKKIINALGGIDVQVPQEFTDYQYPDNAYGYDPVHFDAGLQHFDGDTALKYARSRHGTNQEGSDFARARRQQQIIASLQDRSLALATLLNPNKLISIADIVSDHIETNMQIWESLRLFDMAKNTDQSAVNHVVLSTAPDGLLMVDTNEDGAYLLRPRLGAGNFSEIAEAAQSVLVSNETAPTLADTRTPRPAVTAPVAETTDTPPQARAIRIAVLNGTTYPGLAAHRALTLRGLGFVVTDVANAPQQNYERTVLYPLAEHATLVDALRTIRTHIPANVAVSPPNGFDTNTNDIILILGTDSIPE